ncbi:MAG TPA: peptide chain release factor 2 [Thermotogota bacterium]|nr:peptide chain release factor 2 [Thermotogota bacterium]HRW33754.1 peptide chain release factor 2 [Thermotogota bacterium]
MLTYENKQEYTELRQKFEETSKVFDINSALKRLAKLESEMGNSEFWNDPENAAQVLKDAKVIRSLMEEIKKIDLTFEDASVALEFAEEDVSMEEHFLSLLSKIKKEVKSFELSMLLNEKFDMNNAFLTIHAGAGGTESQDWAQMLMRMYIRWAERRSFSVEIIETQPGDEAGIKGVTMLVKGEYVYGYLKYEQGIHRLVRISPFDSNSRRHTSFASVSILPELDDTISVEINPEDIRVDLYRASGAGGQHVNRTESAVRLTHLPTNIVVTCQSQRNQHQNKETAMKILMAKLYRVEYEKQRQDVDTIQGELNDVSWGNQIRSYVFHPYRMVKDLRTSNETGNTDAVMDGDIDDFIEQELVYFSKQKRD